MSAALMDGRIAEFIETTAPAEITKLGEREVEGGASDGKTRWDALIAALDAEYRKKPQRMEEAASWLWSEIQTLRYDFAAAEERLAQLRSDGVQLADL